MLYMEHISNIFGKFIENARDVRNLDMSKGLDL